MDKKLIHICEVCGKTEILTPEEAFVCLLGHFACDRLKMQ